MAKDGFFGRGGKGFLPERGTQRHLDMVSSMSEAGSAGAMASGSPLLAFLAPMLGGAASSRAANLFDDRQEQESSSAHQAIMEAMSPHARAKADVLLGVMNSPEVSDPYKQLAGSMLSDAMKPRKGRKAAGAWRAAKPEEAAAYGAKSGQIAPNGRFYPSGNSGNARNAEAAMLRQKNEAAQVVNNAVEAIMENSLDMNRQDALASVADDPTLSWAMDLLGNGSGGASGPVAAPGNDPLGIR